MMRSILLIIFLSACLISKSQSNAGFPLRPPLDLTSVFAEYRKNHFHSGIDLRTNNKTDKSVLSIWDGYVSRIRYNAASYGRAVYVTHPNGYTSVYGHLDAFAPAIDSVVQAYQYLHHTFETDIEPEAGQIPVRKGQVLGIAGNSGYSFGEHLHFEIRDAATQDPLNPLRFFPLNDNMEPIFYQIIVYQLQNGGYLPAVSKAWKLRKTGQTYAAMSDIVVPDTFFLGIDVQDYQSITYFRLLPRTIELLLDDTLVWKVEFDRFSFDHTTACRGVFDHEAGLNRKQQIVSTFTGNRAQIPAYRVVSNRGLFSLPDYLPHKLSIKATDTEFNSAVCNVTLRRSVTGKAPDAGPYQIHHRYFHEFSTPNVSLRCDTGTFYADLALNEPLLKENMGEKGPVWQIGYPEIPLLKPMLLTIINDSLMNEKTLLAQTELNVIQKTWKPQINQEGFYQILIDRPGTFKLIHDTIAPSISKTNIPSKGRLTWQNEITFTVTDNSGQIESYSAWIDGQWTLMVYDLKYNLFSIKVNPQQKAGMKLLEVSFTDSAGNKTIKSWSF